MKQSYIIRLNTIVAFFRRINQTYSNDRVSVYAAQASFFAVISAMPLVSMISAILNRIAPAQFDTLHISLENAVPAFMSNTLKQVFAGIEDSAPIPLLSISAVMLLWSASRGIGAIREGVQTVYHAPRAGGYLYKKLASLLYTLCFMVIIIAVVGILVFGESLLVLLNRLLPLSTDLLDTLLRYSPPLFLVSLTFVFSILYYAVARRSSAVTHKIYHHIPGALFASLGWVLFSRFYSLYLNYSDNASFLYGGLTALCLIMLWLYACMMILLSGAEINKLFFACPVR